MQEECDFAVEFGDILENTVLPEGWLVFGLDIGVIEVVRPNGDKFQLIVEKAPDDE